jgi:aminopeptidase-like protein
MVRVIKDLVTRLYPLHRTIIGPGTDTALKLLKDYMPAGYQMEEFLPGPAWTWTIPKRWLCHEATLTAPDGRTVANFHINPLHVVSYSVPMGGKFTWDELAPHLHYSKNRPDAIPWVFKFYDETWGFCLSKNVYDALPREGRYRVWIRTEFVDRPGLMVGTCLLGDSPHELIVCAHICHPMQANDDASGVAVAVEVANRLAENPLPAGSMAVRFLFCPETIGSIAYLANRGEVIERARGGVFIEMAGNENSIVLQQSRRHGTLVLNRDENLMDRVARQALKEVLKREGAGGWTWEEGTGLSCCRQWWKGEGGLQTNCFREGPFGQVVSNDEAVLNGPGVNIPTISLSRWPYPEYHTSDDTPDIIHEDRLQEMADVVERIIRIRATDYRPRRTFTGPLMLKPYGLWVDWRTNWDLNRAIDTITHCLEGDMSVFEIAAKVGLDYWQVRDWLEKLAAQGLITKEVA